MKTQLLRPAHILTACAMVCMVVGFAPPVRAQQPAPDPEPVVVNPGQCGPGVIEEDCTATYNNYQWWDTRKPNFCAAGTGGNVNLSGDNPRDIWNFLVGHDLTPNQAAGVMGNFTIESAFNPKIEEGKTAFHGQPVPAPFNAPHEAEAPRNEWGYGIAQWTFTSRQQPLIDRAAAAGKPVYDLGVQLEYMWYEITAGPAPYNQVLNKLKAANSVADAVRVWEHDYEIHDGDPQPERIKAGEAILTQFGSDTPATPAAPGSPTPSANSANACGTAGTQVVGGYALPTPREFYDQHSDWFTKPHHDYPAADIPVPRNTPIFSATEGKIIAAPNEGGFGRGVTIERAPGELFIYGHGTDGGALQGISVGQTVIPGQLIMHSDDTGSSQGDHLHFEIRINGVKYCPQSLLTAIALGTPIPTPLTTLPTSGCTN